MPRAKLPSARLEAHDYARPIDGDLAPDHVAHRYVLSDRYGVRRLSVTFNWRCRCPDISWGSMQVADLKVVVEREPFRPFTVRLNNGGQYTFKTPRNIGASLDYGMIFYFGEPRGAVRIDRDSIVEIIKAE